MDFYLDTIGFWRSVSLLCLFFVSLSPIYLSTRRKHLNRIYLEIGFLAAALFALFIWRGPAILLNTQINSDESFIISGAICLANDPIPWHSVDPLTTGPLNILVHMWTFLFGFVPNYSSLRWSTLILIFITIYCIRRVAQAILSLNLSYLAALPCLLFYCLAAEDDFVHASTEHLSVTLIATASVLALPLWYGNASFRRCFLVGFLLGAVPFAKLQAVPIALVVGVFFCICSLLTKRIGLIVSMMSGALVIPSAFILLAYFGGALKEMWIRYFAQNLFYSAPHNNNLGKIEVFRNLLIYSDQFILYFAWMVGCLLAALPFLLRIVPSTCSDQSSLTPCARNFPSIVLGQNSKSKGKKKSSKLQLDTNYSLNSVVESPKLHTVVPSPVLLCMALGVWASACFYSVVKSGYIFPHYLVLILFPIAIFGLFGLGIIHKHAGSFAVMVGIFLGCAPPLVKWCVNENPYNNYIAALKSGSDFRDELSHLISQHLKSGESLGIWGESLKYFAETQTKSATRDLIASNMLLQGNPYSSHLLNIYLEDIKKNRPKIFIDTSSDINNIHNFIPLEQRRHTNFPALRDFIFENYEKIGEFSRPNQMPYWVYRLKQASQ